MIICRGEIGGVGRRGGSCMMHQQACRGAGLWLYGGFPVVEKPILDFP